MDRHVVIGTAGHIDHGKTALVKALTGVDTDRLAEEKARGITIDLGFAPLELDGAPASVVDVPGHEGFVRNMVAGATGVDLALLVVAADEGVMPQTSEHVAILRLLGVERGVVALTKCDLVPDAAWRELVKEDVDALIRRTFGGAWPLVEVSAITLEGLDSLRAALRAESAKVRSRAADDLFRLPVDRVFTLPGAGTIVTGTVWSGTVAEGERVLLMPAAKEARVRSIQVHGAPAPRALPARRAALALSGVSRDDAARGSTVVTGDGWRPSRVADVVVLMLEGRGIRPRMRLRAHHGTAEVMARVAALGTASPGGVPVRLALEAPLVLRGGDRFVLRSYSPVTTVGGGVVADPWAEDVSFRGRRRSRVPPEAAPGDPVSRIAWLVARRGPGGMTRSAAAVASGADSAAVSSALSDPQRAGLAVSGPWLVSAAAVQEAAERMLGALVGFQQEHGLEPGMSAQSWRALAGREPQLAELAEDRLLKTGRVVREGALVRTPDWKPGASRAAQDDQERLLDILRRADAEPPSVAELAALLPAVDVPAALRLLARGGRVIPVTTDRYYEAAALERERSRLEQALRSLGSATPAALREHLGRSRKWLIPLLEWADRQGVTVRNGDARVLKVQPGS